MKNGIIQVDIFKLRYVIKFLSEVSIIIFEKAIVGVGRLIYISGPILVMPLGALFTGVQSEKDGSNKTRMLSHMSLGVISTKHGVRRTNLTISRVSTTLFKTSKEDVNQPTPKF